MEGESEGETKTERESEGETKTEGESEAEGTEEIELHVFIAASLNRVMEEIIMTYQADHPEVFGGLPSEGEGIRLVKATARELVRAGRFGLLPALVVGSGCKYLGYRAGRLHRKLPRDVILKCTMNREYWERQWREQP